MDRFNGTNEVDIGGGRRGFRDRNLAAGLVGSIPNADWFNGAQETLLTAVESLGLALNDADNSQLLKALQRIGAANISVVTANTALTAASAGLILVNAGSGPVTVTLPAAAALAGVGYGAGAVNAMRLMIVRVDTSGNAVTISRGGADTLAPGGQVSYGLAVGELIDIVSDGASAWYLLSTNMAGQRFVPFTASGSWTAPAWCTAVEYEVVGAGGGAAGNTSTQASAGGGAGGAAIGVTAITPGTTVPITVGARGGGGAAGGSAGASGGTSSFGSIASATGGSGSYISGALSPGAVGGGGVGGTEVFVGGMGSDGQPAGTGFGGKGGDSIFGGGPRDVSGANGFNGQAYGAGGGGVYGTSAFNGGSGAQGVVNVRF